MSGHRPTEADARLVIDEQLRRAGWDPADRSQVGIEVKIPVGDGTPERIADPALPYKARPERDGRADYVLYDQQGNPLAIIEAKKTAIQPYTAKQQALPYARRLGAPFIFLTNGELIYFWDYQNDDARIVKSFYSRQDLERLLYLRRERKPLATVPIPEHFVSNGRACTLRPYQREAMRALDHAIELGKRRFLLELPTGTGKTALIVLYLKRLIEASHAMRVLFLVDREQLAMQALAAFQDLAPHYSSYWLRPGTEREEKQITVCLLQTMISRYEEFTSGYFDVVIMDESHRSIYGNWQTALTHFDALHIGLTATPAAYIDRNTYRFYGCETNKPDFSYPIQQAFEEGYLIPYTFATGITRLIAEGAEDEEEHYDPAAFERKWTNEETNRLMMQEFDRLAWENYKDLAPGQDPGPGKAIVFAITKHHAARLAQYLNELHPEHRGRYAEVITSDVQDAAELIRRFQQETYPMVAVSVDMLTTGFDLPELLHLVLCRRVRSPILYQQMRGRGTRRADHIGKRRFVIYDFFGNKEYFGDSDADVFSGAATGSAPGGSKSERVPTERELVELGLEDEWLRAVSYVEVGPEGERIDKRAYRSYWEETVRAAADTDPILRKIRNGQPLSAEEEQELARQLNTPDYYFNQDNLRRAYDNTTGDLIDFVRVALGQARVKSREDILTENFQAWLVTKNLTPEQAQYLTLLKNRGIVKGSIRVHDLFEPPLSILDAAGVGVELFGEVELKRIIQELNESVFQEAA